MSRSGYSDEHEQWGMIRWRGAVQSAIRGRRGQAFLRELRDALDAMPEKALITEELEDRGSYCTLGVVGAARGLDMSKIDPEEPDDVGKAFGIASAMAAEIEYLNDEHWLCDETPENRWTRMRAWVEKQITVPVATGANP